MSDNCFHDLLPYARSTLYDHQKAMRAVVDLLATDNPRFGQIDSYSLYCVLMGEYQQQHLDQFKDTYYTLVVETPLRRVAIAAPTLHMAEQAVQLRFPRSEYSIIGHIVSSDVDELLNSARAAELEEFITFYDGEFYTVTLD